MAKGKKSIKPRFLNLRVYQVGFGDCFLLTFHYPSDEKRHVLIDFGSTGQPEEAGDKLMVRVAEDIRDHCGGKLNAVVATHRHKDHISGFARTKDGDGPGDIIRGCEPDVVIQPWTEDPKARPDAKGARSQEIQSRKGFVTALMDMHAIAEMVLKEISRPGLKLNADVKQQLAFLGEDNLSNRSAVENLMTMGKRRHYVYYGSKSGLEEVLPGVNTRVLGPPTVKQSKAVLKQRSKDPDEFWHLQKAAGELASDLKRDRNKLFPDADTFKEFTPPQTRWLVRKMRNLRGEQMLEIVRALDKVMNNTSIILLFEAGDKRLLFPGDAQIENWSYALDKEADKKLLKRVNFYKVGHHGSLNATPKTLWNLFDNRSEEETSNRLQTVVSTMVGKHGHEDKGTEVPRIKLVEELKKQSTYFSTQELEANQLYKDIPMPL